MTSGSPFRRRSSVVVLLLLATLAATAVARHTLSSTNTPPAMRRSALAPVVEAERRATRPASLRMVGRSHSRAVGRGEVDISNVPTSTSEQALAIDPSNDRILLAGSNDPFTDYERVYSSTDGGATWTSASGPPHPRGATSAYEADPAVAIDLNGRQYFAYLGIWGTSIASYRSLFVSTRSGPNAAWTAPASSVDPTNAADAPTLAVDTSPSSPHRNRVYVAWAAGYAANWVDVSHSDDGGETWSPTVQVPQSRLGKGYSGQPAIAVGPRGEVYVSSTANDYRVVVNRSTDGGAHFGTPRTVGWAWKQGNISCWGPIEVPAQPHRCLFPASSVAVDQSNGRYSGRVYVTWTHYVRDGGPLAPPDPVSGVETDVAAFDPDLARILSKPIRLHPRAAAPFDDFFGAIAVDSRSGRVWVCFYDTRGDSMRTKATYSCAASSDGGTTWADPVAVASVASSQPYAQLSAANDYGDYERFAVRNGVAHPIWTDTREVMPKTCPPPPGSCSLERGEQTYTATLTDADIAVRASMDQVAPRVTISGLPRRATARRRLAVQIRATDPGYGLAPVWVTVMLDRRIVTAPGFRAYRTGDQTATYRLALLQPGRHVLAVRAKDAVANVRTVRRAIVVVAR